MSKRARSSATRAEPAAEIAALGPWFHNLHLPDGRQTRPDHPYGDFPTVKWERLATALPEDMRGMRALDIGCNAGFYSFELARRGAAVCAVDYDEQYLRQARWAAREMGLQDRVDLRQANVFDLARWDEQFDLVVFMGVFYHLRYPLLGLDIASRRVRRGGRFVFQSLTMDGEEADEVPPDADFLHREYMTSPGWPKMAFIENRLDGDPTNWWAPNHAAILGMLRTCGLRVRARPAHEIYVCVAETPVDRGADPVGEHLAQIFGSER